MQLPVMLKRGAMRLFHSDDTVFVLDRDQPSAYHPASCSFISQISNIANPPLCLKSCEQTLDDPIQHHLPDVRALIDCGP